MSGWVAGSRREKAQQFRGGPILITDSENHAIIGEVSYSNSKLPATDETLLERTIDWLMGNDYIASSEDILVCHVIGVPYGYPVYSHDRGDIVSSITSWLEGHGIHSIGRFGPWNYANSDECMRQGLCLADLFLKDK
jgi:protoporphyrinogen oxidase